MNAISGSARLAAQFQVAVARKQLDSTQQQGEQSVKLIEATAARPSDNKGQRLNVVA